jgi:hypothetical protein
LDSGLAHIQSYAAYTPRLDRINAEYLGTGRAAEFALVTWNYMDGRHPFPGHAVFVAGQLDLYHTVSTDAGALLERHPPVVFGASSKSAGNNPGGGKTVFQSADPVAARGCRSLRGRLEPCCFV